MSTINSTGLYSGTLYGQNTSRAGSSSAQSSGTNSSAANSAAGTSSGSAQTLKQSIAAAADSAKYSFATVGQNARTVLDAGITAYGKTPGSQTTQDQWTKIFGVMDRRSLYAVSSNQGGQFTPAEQSEAKTLMDNQLTTAGNNVSSSDPSYKQIADYTDQINYLNNV